MFTLRLWEEKEEDQRFKGKQNTSSHVEIFEREQEREREIKNKSQQFLFTRSWTIIWYGLLSQYFFAFPRPHTGAPQKASQPLGFRFSFTSSRTNMQVCATLLQHEHYPGLLFFLLSFSHFPHSFSLSHSRSFLHRSPFKVSPLAWPKLPPWTPSLRCISCGKKGWKAFLTRASAQRAAEP